MMKLHCYSEEKLFNLLRDACLKESISWNDSLQIYSESEEHVTPAERDEILAYLLEVCDRTDMTFSIETFSLTVMLVDRFLASYKVKSKYLECLAVACLYIAVKIKEEDEKISNVSDFLYDCNSKCTVSELLRMELMILTKFSWSVDDKTAVDFLYLFHAILVNKYNQFMLEQKPKQVVNKWNVSLRNRNIASLDISALDSAYPPVDLDFLHTIEYKLKQVLCNHELTTVFRPKTIGIALLMLELEKSKFNLDETNENLSKLINETLETVKQHARINDEALQDCMIKTKQHLDAIDADKSMLESYMDQYYCEMARNHRASSRLSITLSAIAKHLTAIKEEEEPEESPVQPKAPGILTPILNNNNNNNQMDTSNMHNIINDSANYDMKNHSDTSSFHVSYAEKLIGFRDQKRKLSENSITDEDYEFDCENFRH